MSFKSIMRELKEIKEGLSNMYRRGAPLCSSPTTESSSYGQWANLPYELLLHIIQRVEASETSWPSRRALVACASVCRSWREITKGIVKTLEQCGMFTFPVSLKQPPPRENPIECFIKRDRDNSTYSLYLGLSPALSRENSKLLLAAKKIRRATCTEFLISLADDDFSKNYIGKIRTNFIGTKFMIFGGHPPHDSSLPLSCMYVAAKDPSEAGTSKGCSCYDNCNVKEGGTAPTPLEFSSTCTDFEREPLILENKAPRWHEQLQCWCLNFNGRVTVASVKNFQLIISAEPYQLIPDADDETVILQFGKIGKDLFTMDYRYPLSAFQAFDTKPVCE